MQGQGPSPQPGSQEGLPGGGETSVDQADLQTTLHSRQMSVPRLWWVTGLGLRQTGQIPTMTLSSMIWMVYPTLVPPTDDGTCQERNISSLLGNPMWPVAERCTERCTEEAGQVSGEAQDIHRPRSCEPTPAFQSQASR